MKIYGLSLYYPETKVTNDYYYERFPEQRELYEALFDHMDKKERFIVQEKEETSLTLGVKAAQKVLDDYEVDASVIDAVFYASQTPEYLMPTNAVLIHKNLGLKKDCFCVDVNTNCAGMTVGLDFANQYFSTHKEAEYILLVGSEHHSRHSDKGCAFTYPILGDMGCAVLLQRSEQGVIASTYYTNSKNAEKILFPKEGLSEIHEVKSEKHISWGVTDGTIEGAFGPAIPRIEKILETHNISKEEVGLICCNQQTRTTGEFLADALDISNEKLCYVGDQYGYTGSTAAFVCLYHGLPRVDKGEYIIFCSAGAGGTLNIVVFRHNE